MNIIHVADLKNPENGLTYREENLAMKHIFELGSLVELGNPSSDYKSDLDGVRTFVVNHSRDCDGTPLYDLSNDPAVYQAYLDHEEKKKNGYYESDAFGHAIKIMENSRFQGLISRHYSADYLTLIRGPKKNETD